MKVPEHIAKITEQIQAMRKDGHDRNTNISIQLDAMEYGKDKILIENAENPEQPKGNFQNRA